MNLNTIAEVKCPTSADQITHWRDGYAWLAGGTWLFSEPQISTDTLIDLERFNWPRIGAISRWPRHRGDMPHRRALPVRRRRIGARTARARVLRRVFGVVQDLECGDRRRQHLHVLTRRRP